MDAVILQLFNGLTMDLLLYMDQASSVRIPWLLTYWNTLYRHTFVCLKGDSRAWVNAGLNYWMQLSGKKQKAMHDTIRLPPSAILLGSRTMRPSNAVSHQATSYLPPIAAQLFLPIPSRCKSERSMQRLGIP